MDDRTAQEIRASLKRIERALETHTKLGFNDTGPRVSLFLNPNPTDGSLWFTRDSKRNQTAITASSLTAYLENAWRYERQDGTPRLHVQLNAGTPILLQVGISTVGSLTLLASLLQLDELAIDPATEPITIYPVRADQGRTTYLRVRAAGRLIITKEARDLNAAEALSTLSSRYGFHDPYQA